ncbi:MAG TPA: hypothetical protein VMW52_11900 [Phycisphaerae bacterium]|nr:hypothetical protein [Phycisphaerae bacterium]
MKRIIVFLAFAAALLLLPGCLEDIGIRWMPSEEIRQSAQAGADLSAVLAHTGTPPGSVAARQAAALTRTASTYAGPPSQPIDLTDLLTKDTTDAWRTTQEQKTALATRDRVRRRTTDLARSQMETLAAHVAGLGKPTVNADRIVPELCALAQTLAIADAITEEIVIPPDPSLSPEQAATQKALEAKVAAYREIANKQGARPPTVSEVAERVGDKVMDTAEGLGLDTFLYAGLSAIGLGGVGVAVQQRRAKKKAEQAAADAQAATDAFRDGAQKGA